MSISPLRERVRKPPTNGGRCRPRASLNSSTSVSFGPPCLAATAAAWVGSLLGVHSWMLGEFDERVRDEVWHDNPDTHLASSFAPTGKAEAIDGGFRLTGRWSFSSGIDHCSWLIVGAAVPGTGEQPPVPHRAKCSIAGSPETPCPRISRREPCSTAPTSSTCDIETPAEAYGRQQVSNKEERP